ncbi:MAG: TetR/AcrR family transcriptional regulator [Syntrophaceae bacterium]
MHKTTRERILEAAEELLTQNGIEGTTIANIAQKAGVADSLAYQYFKGKDDLVNAIFHDRMEETIEILQDHLEGIIDAKSKLSKFLWYSLKYNDLHKNYVRNLLFECRSNPELYNTEAYALVKKHASNLRGILKTGVDEGIFHADIDLSLLRDIIYGTIDFEAIGCIENEEVKESGQDLNDIMSLIFRMVKRKEAPAAGDKKENILSAAEEVFSRHGFFKAKVSEIARIANIAEGSIYNNFVNKDDLLFSVAGKYLNRNLEALPSIFHIETSQQKLSAFIRFHFTSLLGNYKFFRIYVLDMLLNKKFYKSKSYEAHRKYFKILEDLIEEGKAKGEFHEDVNPRVFRNMFIGAFTHMALRWIAFTDRKYDKLEEINTLCGLLLSAVSLRDDQPAY